MIKLTGSGLPISQYHSIYSTHLLSEWERERKQRTELYGINSTWGETPNIYFDGPLWKLFCVEIRIYLISGFDSFLARHRMNNASMQSGDTELGPSCG